MKKFPAIVYCMCQQGMTSEQLANKVDMRQTTFSRKMNGRTEFTLPEMLAIKEALGTDMALERLFQKVVEQDA